MLNAKVILMASTLTLALTAVFIYMGVVLMGNEQYNSFYLEGVDPKNNTIYLTVKDSIVTYDLSIPTTIQSNQYTHLYRLTTDPNSPYNNKFIHTFYPVTQVPSVNNRYLWDCEATVPINGEVVENTEFSAEINDKEITLNYRGEKTTITLDEKNQPITFGDFSVTKFYFTAITNNDAPTSVIPIIETTCNGVQIENYVNYTSSIAHSNRRELRGRKLLEQANLNMDVEICALWLAAISYRDDSGSMEPLIDVGSCGYESGLPDENGNTNIPITVVAFQGTQPSKLSSLGADIMSLIDNWGSAYEWFVVPYLTEKTFKSFKITDYQNRRISRKKFSICVGHSLGSATAIAADSNMLDLCEKIVGYGSPLALSTSNTPISIYINVDPVQICSERYAWFPIICKAYKDAFIRDTITYLGTPKGVQRNVNYLYKNSPVSFNPQDDAGMFYSFVNGGMTLHKIRTSYKDYWCNNFKDANNKPKSTIQSC